MTFVVIGSNGQVGSFLVQQLGDKAMPVTRSQLDLSARRSVEDFFSYLVTPRSRPAALINCAAYTAVDEAESETGQVLNHQVNAVAPGWLAQHCQQLGLPMVHVSTDYVFDGLLPLGQEYATAHRTSPVNAYGLAKAAGEQAVVAAGGHVVRTAWVYSGPEHPGKDFASTMLRLAQQGTDPNVVSDQFGRPSHAAVVASALKEVAVTLSEGATIPNVLHATGSGEPASWCDFAREIFRATGHDPQRVTAIPTSAYPTPAARPANSALSLTEWEEAGLAALPAWRETLKAKAAVW